MLCIFFGHFSMIRTSMSPISALNRVCILSSILCIRVVLRLCLYLCVEYWIVLDIERPEFFVKVLPCFIFVSRSCSFDISTDHIIIHLIDHIVDITLDVRYLCMFFMIAVIMITILTVVNSHFWVIHFCWWFIMWKNLKKKALPWHWFPLLRIS